MGTGAGMGWGRGDCLRRGLGKEGQRESELGNSFFYLVNKYLLSAYSVQVIF